MSRISTMARLRELIPEPSPIASAKILDHLDDQALEFVRSSTFMVIASLGADGIELSPKGDPAGFVAVEDPRTLLIPERRGNQLALGLQNILSNDQVGAIFFRPNASELLRVTGRAELVDDDDLRQRLSARGEPAVLVIRLRIQRAYFHCARSISRSGLWKPDGWPAPMRISFGRIISQATKNAEIEARIDAATEVYNSTL